MRQLDRALLTMSELVHTCEPELLAAADFDLVGVMASDGASRHQVAR